MLGCMDLQRLISSLFLLFLANYSHFYRTFLANKKSTAGQGWNVLTSYIYNNEHAIMMGQSQK